MELKKPACMFLYYIIADHIHALGPMHFVTYREAHIKEYFLTANWMKKCKRMLVYSPTKGINET
jgi:hypothetical protein